MLHVGLDDGCIEQKDCCIRLVERYHTYLLGWKGIWGGFEACGGAKVASRAPRAPLTLGRARPFSENCKIIIGSGHFPSGA